MNFTFAMDVIMSREKRGIMKKVRICFRYIT
jgi:hypothetical protein